MKVITATSRPLLGVQMKRQSGETSLCSTVAISCTPLSHRAGVSSSTCPLAPPPAQTPASQPWHQYCASSVYNGDIITEGKVKALAITS